MAKPVNHPVVQDLKESVANLRSQQPEGLIDDEILQTSTEAPGPKGVKLSARDILAMLSTRRMDMDDIQFTGDGLQGSCRGGKGDVVVATIPTDGRTSDSRLTVAVKQLRLGDGIDEERFLRVFVNELRVVDGLSHPNVVTIIGFVEDLKKRIYWLVFPWEANGNVREFLLSGEWELPERVSLIKDVASGLEYLHTREPPICHGDLKSLNVLVNSDYRAVITDFGSARVSRNARGLEAHPPHRLTIQENCDASRDDGPLQVTLSATNAELTLTGPSWSFRWAAPEVLNEEQPDLASDIWALGWIAWEVITDNYPFPEAKTQQHITIKVVTGQLPSIHKNSQLSQIAPLCHVMDMCWKLDPQDRPSAAGCQRTLRWIPAAIPAVESGAKPKIRSAALLQEIGEMHRLQGRNEEASRMFEEGLTVARSTEDKPVIASLLLELGSVQTVRSEYADAEASFTQALDICKYIGDYLGQANALYGLGDVHEGQYGYAKAEEFYTQAQTIYTNIGNTLGQANALRGLGSIYDMQSQFEEAVECYKSALNIYTFIGDEGGRANALHRLGGIHEAQSHYAEAKESYTQALNICKIIGDALGRANALRGLGSIYSIRSQYCEAGECYTSALTLCTTIGDERGRANALLRLGDIHVTQCHYAEAEEFCTQALTIYKNIGDDLGRANALHWLGEVHDARVNYADAEESYTQALEIFTSVVDNLGRVNTSTRLSRIRLRQGRHAEAKSLASDAAVISDIIDYQWGKTSSRQLLREVVVAEESFIESHPRGSTLFNPTAEETMATAATVEVADPYYQIALPYINHKPLPNVTPTSTSASPPTLSLS